MRSLLAIVLFVLSAAPDSTDGRLDGDKIDNRLFDANHCLERIETSPSGESVDFYWGCGEEKYITMECVVDGTGYRDLGPQYPPAGWHCNHPLPALRLDGIHRISDVAVGSVGGRAAWAACFVDHYGDFSSREKPYHRTPCYRALKKIQGIVNETQRDPHEVARELLH